MREPKRVEFKTDDWVTLRGDFYQADGDDRPVVVMTAGLALLKEFAAPWALEFQEAGVSALLFDYRGYGSSEGAPRHETNLLQQAEDYRDGVSAAMNLPGVDPAKVIIWGVGHGGAAAIIAAADDTRPAAVILQSPIVSGRDDSRRFPKGVLEQAWRDRETKTRSDESVTRYIQAWPESFEEAQGQGSAILFHFEAAFGLISDASSRSKAAMTPWENRISTRSLLNVASVDAKDWLHKIEQPTLYLVPPFDPFTGTAEYQEEAFSRMGANGKFVMFVPPSEGGFKEFVAASMVPQLAFLKQIF